LIDFTTACLEFLFGESRALWKTGTLLKRGIWYAERMHRRMRMLTSLAPTVVEVNAQRVVITSFVAALEIRSPPKKGERCERARNPHIALHLP
jgi:hypothetical protein